MSNTTLDLGPHLLVEIGCRSCGTIFSTQVKDVFVGWPDEPVNKQAIADCPTCHTCYEIALHGVMRVSLAAGSALRRWPPKEEASNAIR